MSDFPEDVVSAVCAHMNTDHADDNILIARAFIDSGILSARMIDVDSSGSTWLVTDPSGERRGRIQWARPALERADLRREVVALYDRACEKLGVTPREH